MPIDDGPDKHCDRKETHEGHKQPGAGDDGQLAQEESDGEQCQEGDCRRGESAKQRHPVSLAAQEPWLLRILAGQRASAELLLEQGADGQLRL